MQFLTRETHYHFQARDAQAMYVYESAQAYSQFQKGLHGSYRPCKSSLSHS